MTGNPIKTGQLIEVHNTGVNFHLHMKRYGCLYTCKTWYTIMVFLTFLILPVFQFLNPIKKKTQDIIHN